MFCSLGVTLIKRSSSSKYYLARLNLLKVFLSEALFKVLKQLIQYITYNCSGCDATIGHVLVGQNPDTCLCTYDT